MVFPKIKWNNIGKAMLNIGCFLDIMTMVYQFVFVVVVKPHPRTCFLLIFRGSGREGERHRERSIDVSEIIDWLPPVHT